MKTDFPFHHSYIENEMAVRRAVAKKKLAIIGLCVASTGIGFVLGVVFAWV
jgi:hypothetical protein